MSKIDLATYKVGVEIDNTKLEDGLNNVDKKMKSSLSKTGDDIKNLEKPLDGLDRSFGRVFDNAERRAKGLKVAFGAIVAKATKEILDIGSSFESTMAEVEAIMGATNHEMQNLIRTTKSLGNTTIYSANESAEALKYMAMAGWDAKTSTEALPHVLNLATASGEDLARVSDIVTDNITAFGLEAKDTAGFVDLLASVSSNSNTNIGMLGESFQYAGSSLAGFGYTAEDSAFALGLLANNGLKGSKAGRNLAGIITNLLTPTKEMTALFDQWNFSMRDADGSVRPLAESLLELREIYLNLDESMKPVLASQIAGQGNIAAFNALMNSTDEEIRQLTQATSEYNGEAQRMADIMENTLEGKTKKLKASLSNLAIDIFELLYPALISITEAVQQVISWLNNLTDSQKELMVKTVLTIAKIKLFSSVLKSLGAIVISLGLKLSKLVTFIVDVGGAVKAVSAMIIGSINPIVALVGALTIGLVFFRDELKTVTLALVDLVSLIVNTLVSLVQVVGALGLELIQALGQGIMSGIGAIVNIIQDLGRIILETILSLGSSMFNAGLDIMRGLLNGIVAGAQAVINTVVDLANAIITTFASLLGIHSPSRVFKQFGADTIDGLVLGIRGNTHKVISELNNLVSIINQKMNEALAQMNKLGGALQTALRNKYTSQRDSEISSIKNKYDTIIEKEKQQQAQKQQNHKNNIDNIKNESKEAEKGIRDQIKAQDKASKDQIKGIDRAIKENKKLHKQQLRQLEKRHKLEIKSIETIADERIKSYQYQIDNINSLIDEEDRADKKRENREKLANLQNKILTARTKEDKIKYEKEYQKEVERQRKEERRDQKLRLKESLEDKIKAVEEEKKIKIDNIKEEQEEEKYKLQLQQEAQIEALETQKEVARESAEIERERLNSILESQREASSQQIDIMNNVFEEEKELDEERLKELEALQEEEIKAVNNKYDELLDDHNLFLEARKLVLDGDLKGMIDLLEEYYPEWQDAGMDFALSLVHGLNSEKQTMQDAIKEAIDVVPLVRDQIQALDLLEKKIKQLTQLEEEAQSGKGKAGSKAGGIKGGKAGGLKGKGLKGGGGGLLGGLAGDLDSIGASLDELDPKLDSFGNKLDGLGERAVDISPTFKKVIKDLDEEVRVAVENFQQASEAVRLDLDLIMAGNKTLTQNIIDDMLPNIENMADETIANYERQKELSLAELDEMYEMGLITSEKEKKEMEAFIIKEYEGYKDKTRQGKDKIIEVLQKASDEKRALTDEEKDLINGIYDEMYNEGLESAIDNKDDLLRIKEELKNKSEKIALDQAKKLIEAAKDEKEKTIEYAERKYDLAIEKAKLLRKEGTKEANMKADQIIESAKRERDETVKEASGQYQDVVKYAKDMAGDHGKYIDEMTGESISTFEVYRRKFVEKIKDIKDSLIDFNKLELKEKVLKVKDMASSVISGVLGKLNEFINKKVPAKNVTVNSTGGGGGGRQFAVGTPFVNHDQSAIIHKGEAIIPARYNPFTKGGHFKPEFAFGGGGNVTYETNINIKEAKSELDISRAVTRGIRDAEKQRERNLKKRGR